MSKKQYKRQEPYHVPAVGRLTCFKKQGRKNAKNTFKVKLKIIKLQNTFSKK